MVKLEPHDNGPLFTEMHVMYRLGLEVHRTDWTPKYGEVGTGKRHTYEHTTRTGRGKIFSEVH